MDGGEATRARSVTTHTYTRRSRSLGLCCAARVDADASGWRERRAVQMIWNTRVHLASRALRQRESGGSVVGCVCGLRTVGLLHARQTSMCAATKPIAVDADTDTGRIVNSASTADTHCMTIMPWLCLDLRLVSVLLFRVFKLHLPRFACCSCRVRNFDAK